MLAEFIRSSACRAIHCAGRRPAPHHTSTSAAVQLQAPRSDAAAQMSLKALPSPSPSPPDAFAATHIGQVWGSSGRPVVGPVQSLARRRRPYSTCSSAYNTHTTHNNNNNNNTHNSNSKQFRLSDYDIIGFDLDGTLLRYNIDEMVPLVYGLLRQFLVEQRHYSRRLLERDFDADFVQKGLLLDADRGNVVKLGSDGRIIRACHGTTPLADAQITELYGPHARWSLASQFVEDPLSTWNDPSALKIRALCDHFDMAASLNFSQAIDDADAHRTTGPAPYTVWPDLLDGLIQLYKREHFSNGRSGYFQALQAQRDRYVMKTRAPVLDLLGELRQSGKAIYLLTGSNIDFANFTASYAFGRSDWQSLFDCVSTYAKKPGFFTGQRPFLRVEGLREVAGSELPFTEPLALNATYSQGNWKQLRAALAAKVGKNADEVRCLYVGDNLIQDVYTPVKHHDMDALAVCEELLADAGTRPQGDYEFREITGSSFWGSYFCLNNRQTLWASIIARSSQQCVPLVDRLVGADSRTLAKR